MFKVILLSKQNSLTLKMERYLTEPMFRVTHFLDKFQRVPV